MHGLNPATWETFALGQLGASAALFGLVFVGISINLRAVLTSRVLVNRAAEAVLLLASLLVASTAVLVPDQTRRSTGIELCVIGIVTLFSVIALQRGPRSPDGGTPVIVPENAVPIPRTARAARRLLGTGAAVLVVIAGVSLLSGLGAGLYWWAGAVVLTYAAALSSAWVLLIEILR